MNDDDFASKGVPLHDLKVDPTAEDLRDSPAMQPYLKLAAAVMAHKDPRPAVDEIAALRLEERYTWRVASALKMGVCRFRESERRC